MQFRIEKVDDPTGQVTGALVFSPPPALPPEGARFVIERFGRENNLLGPHGWAVSSTGLRARQVEKRDDELWVLFGAEVSYHVLPDTAVHVRLLGTGAEGSDIWPPIPRGTAPPAPPREEPPPSYPPAVSPAGQGRGQEPPAPAPAVAPPMVPPGRDEDATVTRPPPAGHAPGGLPAGAGVPVPVGGDDDTLNLRGPAAPSSPPGTFPGISPGISPVGPRAGTPPRVATGGAPPRRRPRERWLPYLLMIPVLLLGAAAAWWILDRGVPWAPRAGTQVAEVPPGAPGALPGALPGPEPTRPPPPADPPAPPPAASPAPSAPSPVAPVKLPAALVPPRQAPAPFEPSQPPWAAPMPAAPAVPPKGPPAAAAPAPVAASPFERGQADRREMEAWVARQPPGVRYGIDYWAERRNRPNPGDCFHPDPQFVQGCNEARRRFGPVDAQRRSDPDYWRGWNNP
ncbi:hypothetical protein [Roseomonas acroporae]|uniref:hypothetical protein n=1 Tax=Roseomonas acroporae TaxID=2937791 RepID=UPI0024A7648B|nr:hypothetical protein [Roseomonas acroporae]